MSKEETTLRDNRPPLEQILAEVMLTRQASETAANAAMETGEDVRGLRRDFAALDQRVTRLELRNVWLPVAASVVALVVAGASLLFAFAAYAR